MPATLESILAKCKRAGDCMEYPMPAFGSAIYPAMYFNGCTRAVHRVVWELLHGLIPSGTFILHACDNPMCVNPAHLFAGTQRDNVHDMFKKGRAKNGYGPMQLKSSTPAAPRVMGTN